MNILLVDDDRFVLAALNHNMDWNSLAIEEVYTASNINQAKEVIRSKSIQILITDIDMPQGSGIDLLTWIREENYDIQTIFLTNYADFSFAQKAVELQSLEYYLKPIEFDKLTLIVRKAVKKAEASWQARNAANISVIWEDIKGNISEHFWIAYLKRQSAYTEEELEVQLSKIHLPYSSSDTFIIIYFDLYGITLSEKNDIKYSYPDTKELSMEFEHDFHTAFSEVLSTYDILLELNPVSRSYLAILNCTGAIAEDLLFKLSALCKSLIGLTNKKYNSSLSCYIGLPVTFSTFHSGLKQLSFMNENIIDCRNKVFQLRDYSPVKSDYSLPNLKLLDEYLKLEKRSLFIKYCKDYLTALAQGNKLNYTVLASFQVDIIQLIYSYLKEKEILAHKLLQGKTNDTLLELSSKSIESMILYITYLINTALDYAAFSASEKSVASIICEYVDLHFADNINRSSLAEIVYLDPDYTARLFKKETGSSLVNYVIKKRIEMAKDLLLHTSLSINLVSDKVGYDNYSYFTKLFKKETGLTPMDYRNVKRI